MVDQAGGAGALRPELARQAALDQLCLDLQRAEWLQVEGQFDAPETLLARVLFLPGILLLLQLDLQRDQFLLIAHGHFQLPGGQQVAVGRHLGLGQAGQLVGLQPRDGCGGQLEQGFQVAFVFGGLG
ncbi:hypothetical protein D3C76_1160500 [compost metagenome]